MAGDSASCRRLRTLSGARPGPRPGAFPREKLSRSLDHGGRLWLGRGKPARPPTAESELPVPLVPAAGGGQQQLGHAWPRQHRHLQPWLGAGTGERPPPGRRPRDRRVLSQRPAPAPPVSRSPDASLSPRPPVPGSTAHTRPRLFPSSGSKQGPERHAEAAPACEQLPLVPAPSPLFSKSLPSSKCRARWPRKHRHFHRLSSLVRRERETEARGGSPACPGSQRQEVWEGRPLRRRREPCAPAAKAGPRLPPAAPEPVLTYSPSPQVLG